MGATYRIEDGKLRTSGGSQTEMGCDQPLSAQDAWVFSFILSSPDIALDGNHLTLTQGDLVGQFLDNKEAHPDLALAGPTWTVGTIISGQIAMPAMAVATFTFNADGRVAISTGCNTGDGTYAVDGANITFTNISLTKIACVGAAGDTERAVLATLNADGLTYLIEASNLTLESGGAGLILSGK